PTGHVASSAELRALAELAAERNLLLISDEIYRAFCYDGPCHSPAEFNENVLVIDGFSKSHGMTGWRLGFAHGPKALIEEVAKLQQFTSVRPPSRVQPAGPVAGGMDLAAQVEAYRHKRDLIHEGLQGYYELPERGGAFYLFAKAPQGSGQAFVER